MKFLSSILLFRQAILLQPSPAAAPQQLLLTKTNLNLTTLTTSFNILNRLWRKIQQKTGFAVGLVEIFGPIVLAVPKKKTSHSKKRMRSANKGLKDKVNVIQCPGCGRKNLIHHLCFHCYCDFRKREKGLRSFN
ncbi:7430_t:CDS:1 [Entrophospora sp. SA101]|nr:8492_t:CDS:1 [Entrophospora candida]CAH1761648.1 10070_t:CDS:1 [Entrophospora sp. SA101]CAJ0753473.1 15800_t:CDS:1 [Entrophospora sp. SA101]CAJ0768824.1 7430_t:CDS:1 [Entrophospora sp. SA101]CAJ0830751.1 12502_t:CDS:1 [Entrophospora sp. SA101]